MTHKQFDTVYSQRIARNHERNHLSNTLADYANTQPSLQDFLSAVARLSDTLSTAIDPFDCGTEGRAIAEYDVDHSLVFGWCYGRVEYAYIG